MTAPDALLREALDELVRATSSCPDAMMQSEGDYGEQNLYRWWWERAAPALGKARAALAATPPASASGWMLALRDSIAIVRECLDQAKGTIRATVVVDVPELRMVLSAAELYSATPPASAELPWPCIGDGCPCEESAL